jgi:uncharacterized DUF497 family protein
MKQAYEFDWDPRKAASNLKKHGVTFLEATTVFTDPLQISMLDETHSDEEDRWLTIGLSERGRVLILSHTMRSSSRSSITIVRLISCRKATKREVKEYIEA